MMNSLYLEGLLEFATFTFLPFTLDNADNSPPLSFWKRMSFQFSEIAVLTGEYAFLNSVYTKYSQLINNNRLNYVRELILKVQREIMYIQFCGSANNREKQHIP